jgi:hypothetical protein
VRDHLGGGGSAAYDRHVSVFDVFGGGTPDPFFRLRLYRSSL